MIIKIGHTKSERIDPVFGWEGMKASIWEIAGFGDFIHDEIFYNDESELVEWLGLLIPIISGIMRKWFDLGFDYDSRIIRLRKNRNADDVVRLGLPQVTLRAASLPKEVLETLQNA